MGNWGGTKGSHALRKVPEGCFVSACSEGEGERRVWRTVTQFPVKRQKRINVGVGGNTPVFSKLSSAGCSGRKTGVLVF